MMYTVMITYAIITHAYLSNIVRIVGVEGAKILECNLHD